MNSYMSYNREQWSDLRNSVPMTLTASDLTMLQGINESLSLSEVEQIYLPLSRLLNLYVEARQGRNHVLHHFLNKQEKAPPFIIGIAGSVAVGKSTTARLLRALLSRWVNHPKVELITTDGFLHPNKELLKRNLMGRKGFPESFDTKSLIDFISRVKSGERNISAPVYSHITYDITEEEKVVDQPDVLIIEGLNVLQSSNDYPENPFQVFISDFLDFSIYVDADSDMIESWYVDRFMALRESAFTKPGSYFTHYTKLSEQEAVDKAKSIWTSINGVNLQQNILPTKSRAHLVLRKGEHHRIEEVILRK